MNFLKFFFDRIIWLTGALVVALCGFILGLSSSSSEYWLLGIGIVVGGMLMVIGYLILQPRSRIVLYFKVPGVPLLPCVSIFINTYLMFQLESKTWIQFGVWMAVGMKFLIKRSMNAKCSQRGRHLKLEILRHERKSIPALRFIQCVWNAHESIRYHVGHPLIVNWTLYYCYLGRRDLKLKSNLTF